MQLLYYRIIMAMSTKTYTKAILIILAFCYIKKNKKQVESSNLPLE